MRRSKVKYKYIGLKRHDRSLQVELGDWVLKNTDAKLISLALSAHIKKFIRELQDIPLSDELQ